MFSAMILRMKLLVMAGLPFTVLAMVDLAMQHMGTPNLESCH